MRHEVDHLSVKYDRTWITDTLLLALFFGIIYFLFLGVRPLFVPDEGRYAEIAREMVVNHDLVTPYLNGIKYFEKPALFYWLGALAIHVGGLNLWALRSVNALLGIMGILLTYLTARQLFSRVTGLLAAGILGSSTLYFVMAHMISLDLPVTVFLTACLYALLLSLTTTHPATTRHYFWLSATMAALAVLTKGLIGIVFPGLIGITYLILTQDWRALKRLPVITAILLFLALTAPWHLLVGSRHPDFYYFYFIEQHFLRYTQTEIGHYQPNWFFIPCLILGFFPWIAYLPQTLISAYRGTNRHSPQGKILLFLLLWASIIFVFFSFSKSKLIPYILPVMPPLAVLTASCLTSYLRDKQASWTITVSHLGMLLLACAIGYVLIAFPQSTPLPDHAKASHLLSLAAGILVLGLGINLILARHTLRYALTLVHLTVLGFLLTIIVAAPSIDARSILPLARIIKKQLTPTTEVITYNQYYQDLPFYLERRVSILNWQNELTHGMLHQENHDWMIDNNTFWRIWKSPRQVFVVLDHSEYTHLLQRHPEAHPYQLSSTINNTLITNHPFLSEKS